MVVPNGIPAIISEELFDTVQEMLNVNRRSIAKHKAAEEYLLTTKLYCGKCKNQMFGESGKNHAGIIYRYYKCADVKRHGGCDKKSVKKEWIEDLVVNDTVKMLLDDKLIEYIADKIIALVGTEDPLLPAYRSQVDDVQKSISNLIKAMEQGIITESTKQRLEELEAQKKKLNTEIAALESKKPNINKEMILAYLKSFRNYDPDRVDHRRKLINHFVNKIYLYDDKVIITYNFKNVKKTISFKEVEGAIDSSESLSAGAPITKHHPNGWRFVVSELKRTRRTSGTEQQSGGLLRPRATKRPQPRESSPVWGARKKHLRFASAFLLTRLIWTRRTSDIKPNGQFLPTLAVTVWYSFVTIDAAECTVNYDRYGQISALGL